MGIVFLAFIKPQPGGGKHEISSPSCSFRNEVLIKLTRGLMAIPLHPKQVVSTEKLLPGRPTGSPYRLVVEKRMFTHQEMRND